MSLIQKSWELSPPGDCWSHWNWFTAAFGPGVDELHFCEVCEGQSDAGIVREKEHQSLQDFCGKADCVVGLDSFDQEYGSCYAGTLC